MDAKPQGEPFFPTMNPDSMGLRETHMCTSAVLQIRRLNPTGGGLVLGPRPGRKSKAALVGMGLTHVCTLLGEHESPEAVGVIAEELGCSWVWLPIAGGNLETLQALDVKSMVTQLAEAISGTAIPRVYLHCSAGIHRTGFFASVLLRLVTEDIANIPRVLAILRPVTAEQLGPDRLAVAIRLANALLSK